MMANTSILSFCSIVLFEFFSAQFVFSQTIYDDISQLQEPFAKNLNSSVCIESVQKCEMRLYQSEKTLQRCEFNMRMLQKTTDELENNFTEIIKGVPKKILSWTVDDLCSNIPDFVFEDSEICSFFYNCSQADSYLQQCPYPQLFSDINSACEDPSNVSCGSRTITDAIYTCDFEHHNESSCFLVDSDSGTFTWTRNKGSTGSTNTGPSSAYHGMYYAYIETSSPRQLGDNAVLESDKRFEEKFYCLNLLYHMHGSDIGNLTIKTENSYNRQAILRQISGNQGNMWRRMESLEILLNENTKILIEATRGDGYMGDISIDFVTLSPRKCPKT